MLARRALAVTPDKEFAKALKSALMAAGTVAESAASVADLADEVSADVVAIHLPDNKVADLAALGRKVGPDAWIVVVLGKSDLSVIVDAMQATERVAGILIADRLQPGELPATITRLIHGDIFGLEKVVPWGTRIYSILVGDYQEKAIAINQISEFAATVGVRRKYREALEQCADEMLMNAMYDAPVGAGGKPLFAEVSTKDRVGLKLEQRVVVQYACDGRAFALSVRDAYGSFARETLLRFLHKCLHSEQQIDRKAGGAGLGLYLMANSASLILFNLLPGVATEVICIFDITAPKLQLQHLGVFSEKVDATGRLVAGPPRAAGVPVERRSGLTLPPAARVPKALMLALGSAIVLLLAIIALVAYPRFATVTGTLSISTRPPGATVEIDGRVRGTTADGALVVQDLQADTGHRVVARLDGHADAETLVEVGGGETSTIELALPSRTATVVVESEPSGADVLVGGRELGKTPLTLSTLPPGDAVELTLRHAGFRDAVRSLTVPPAGGQATVSVGLAMADALASVRITSEPPGAAVFQNGERLAGVVTPVTHLVEADRAYTFTLALPGHMPASVEARVRPGQREVPLSAKLVAGGSLVVTSSVPARVTVSNTTACKKRALPLDCPIENGRHTVELRNDDPYLSETFEVTVQGGEVRREVALGVVQARAGHTLAVRGTTKRAFALPPGRHSVRVQPSDGSGAQTVSVEVRPGDTVMLPASVTPAAPTAPAPTPAPAAPTPAAPTPTAAPDVPPAATPTPTPAPTP